MLVPGRVAVTFSVVFPIAAFEYAAAGAESSPAPIILVITREREAR
jgi:hypothetical protein